MAPSALPPRGGAAGVPAEPVPWRLLVGLDVLRPHFLLLPWIADMFEGSYLGDVSRLPADARLECKICWWVYDPEHGDPVWQIQPGTAFAELPDHWRCPQCDGAAEQFMVVM